METLSPITRPGGVRPGNRFERVLEAHGSALTRGRIRTLQINLGRLCNQACKHCHVEAGPKRTEIMAWPVVERLLTLARDPAVEVVDLTGGAPEMNPHFGDLVTAARRLGRQVIDRCNLTILFEAGHEDLPGFLAAQQVQVVALGRPQPGAGLGHRRGGTNDQDSFHCSPSRLDWFDAKWPMAW